MAGPPWNRASPNSVRQSISLLVVGVRDGDVANNVPAPQSLALALLALGAAGALSRKRLTR